MIPEVHFFFFFIICRHNTLRIKSFEYFIVHNTGLNVFNSGVNKHALCIITIVYVIMLYYYIKSYHHNIK